MNVQTVERNKDQTFEKMCKTLCESVCCYNNNSNNSVEVAADPKSVSCTMRLAQTALRVLRASVAKN